jgi:hypothetical protein
MWVQIGIHVVCYCALSCIQYIDQHMHFIKLTFFYYVHFLANILSYTCVVHICKYMNKVHVNDNGDLNGSYP